jgi:hypothetical protein
MTTYRTKFPAKHRLQSQQCRGKLSNGMQAADARTLRALHGL